MNGEDRLEILSLDLLEKHSDLVMSFRQQADALGIQLGWHYDLDLAWIAYELGDPSGMRVLDAGAGTGVLQWWLAERRAHVISVDRLDRSDLSCRYRLAYQVKGLRPGDLIPTWRLISHRLTEKGQDADSRLRGTVRAAFTTILEPLRSRSQGTVTLFQHALENLPDLKDDTFDAVVSVSALEHNQAETLTDVVSELLRVLKPGGLLLATVATGGDQDWFHEPSQGWCYSESTLRQTFGVPLDGRSNFSEHDILLGKLRSSEVLKSHLAPAYFQSGNNGMPWGVWDPRYQPVGVRRRKPGARI